MILLLLSFSNYFEVGDHIKELFIPRILWYGHAEYNFAAVQEEYVSQVGWRGPDLKGFGHPKYVEREKWSAWLRRQPASEAYKMDWWAKRNPDSEISLRVHNVLMEKYLCPLCEGSGRCWNNCFEGLCGDSDCVFCRDEWWGTLKYTFNPTLCSYCMGNGTPYLWWIAPHHSWEFK